MKSVVLDASAVIALVRDELEADRIAGHLGTAVISAVDFQEVIKALLLRGFVIEVIREILDNLRLDVRPHDADAAFASRLSPARRAGTGVVWGTGPAWRSDLPWAVRCLRPTGNGRT